MKTPYAWLESAVREDCVIVTANRRLARELRQIHADRQLEAGLRAWQTPPVHFVGDWLNGMLETSDAGLPLRLGPAASDVLWEQAIQAALAETVPGIAGIVRQFRQAWGRLQEWQVPLREVQHRASGTEQRLFARAANQYCDLLREHKGVDDAGVHDVVRAAIAAGELMLPPSLVLAGFDRITPGLRAVLDSLSDKGVPIASIEAGERRASVSVAAFQDAAAELRAAGNWARQHLLAEPASRCAIVCPDLETASLAITRHIREGFAPGWQYGGALYQKAVNVSFGRPLSDFPLIAVALMVLRWGCFPLASREVSILLRSRWILGGSIAGRCRLERFLRRLPDRHWQPGQLMHALRDGDSTPDTLAFFEAVEKLSQCATSATGKRGPGRWAEHFDRLLDAAGWPGSDAKDSNEIQVLNRWRELLNELARLERVLPQAGVSEALARLAALASQTVFQPEGQAGVLPVLGVLEAAGLEFDRIWLTSVDASRWPSHGSPLPFVSRALQREHQMPDATPVDSLAFSRRVLQRVLSSADDAILSWARSEDGVEMQASPLIAELSATSAIELESIPVHASAHIGLATPDRVEHDPVPAVIEGEGVRGGAYTVQRQATEPFAAFAQGRLGVENLQRFQAGLSARMRGSILHDALSYLYEDCPSRADLIDWSDDEVRRRVGTSTDRALGRYGRDADDVLRRILSLERQRIEGILRRQISVDCERDEFRIAAIEEALGFERHDITLNLRADRVDALAHGLLVVDYKSGAEKALLNKDGEINDLQLVVYAMALNETIAGLALINLDSKKVTFRRTPTGDEWPDVLSAWMSDADTAIRGIAAGRAAVNIALTSDQARPLNVLSRFEELRRGG